MASPIEKARDIIAKGEKATRGRWAIYQLTRIIDDCDLVVADCFNAKQTQNATYIAAANPADLLPLLRLLVECEEWLEAYHPECALLDKLRGES